MILKYRSNRIFYTALFLFTLLLIFLFYSQSYGGELYPSDFPAHVSFSLGFNTENTASGYSFLHICTFVLSKLINIIIQDPIESANYSMIILLVSSEILSVLLIRYNLNRKYNKKKYLINFISLSIMIISMILINPAAKGYWYLGTGTPNPWHNPTFIFCKPFSIPVLLTTYSLLIDFKLSKSQIPTLIIFSTLSMWAKPSFMMTFIPSVVFMLFALILQKKISFVKAFEIIAYFIPSIILLLLINIKVFHSGGESNSVIFVLGQVWYHYSNSIFISLVFSLAFPSYVYIVFSKSLNRKHILLIINLVISFLMLFFLAESGNRMYHINFGWSYLFAMFFLHLQCIEELLLNDIIKKKYFLVGSGIYMLHFVSGVIYFIKIILGFSYA